MTTENLIVFVYSKPEVWDQHSKNYSSKDLKSKAWSYIGEKMNCTANQAKVRWTNLRDLFRRELKKTLKMAKITGDPESYIPRWRHFKSLLFLKDQMVKDDELELASLAFDDSMSKHYPQTIIDDGDSKGEAEYYIEYPQTPANHVNMLPPLNSKRHADNISNSYEHNGRSTKKQRGEESSYMGSTEDYSSFISNTYNETDEDYHFVLSILPSIRRIRLDRKTSFKMKVLQLIMEEEENCTHA